jgi:hypothetical protein
LPGPEGNLAVDRRHPELGLVQGESLDRFLEVGIEPVLALPDLHLPAGAGQPVLPTPHQPVLNGAEASSVLSSNLRVRDMLFQKRQAAKVRAWE